MPHKIFPRCLLIATALSLVFSFFQVTALDLSAPITPLVPESNLNPELVELGQLLFNDKRLSKDNSTSCASCHNLKHGGADNRQFSIGVGGAVGELNSPSVFNTSKSISQFWDGRAKNLMEQVDGPIGHPLEMNTSWKEIVNKLKQDSHYRKLFKRLYSAGITSENIKKALVEFERSLVTVDSPFDQFLNGDESAISSEAKEGFQIFNRIGCVACHQGEAVGGNMYQKFGIIRNYLADRKNPHPRDFGRYNVTKNEADRYVFKVPSLRNVELTAPYFHDGSAADLDTAVAIMGEVQLGQKISPSDRKKIIEFLKTLTGKTGHEE